MDDCQTPASPTGLCAWPAPCTAPSPRTSCSTPIAAPSNLNDSVRNVRGVGIQQSMARTGVCWANAMAEWFWDTLKTELYDRRYWTIRAKTRRKDDRRFETDLNNYQLHKR